MGVFRDRLKHAWNAFLSGDEEDRRNPFGDVQASSAGGYSQRPDRVRLRIGNERSILASVLTRLSVDVASIAIKHIRLDDQKRYKEDVDSQLNQCLTVEANIDQSASHFRRDVAMSLFEQGNIAIVPVDTTLNPNITGGFDILSLRVGNVVQWFPRSVRVSVYNEKTGRREEVTLAKKFTAIVENPLYTVMNEPNSTLQRLIRKLNILDAVDDQSASGKLDLIIQLPYSIRSDTMRARAEQRKEDIEFQLKGSQYGIAYTDGTEKITQLNRPAENNLLAQIEYLVEMLYSQLGLTPEIMNGTADEGPMLNYYARTIEPVLEAITEAMARTFLTKTARSQGQTIRYFKSPFKLVPVSQLAELTDKFVRNEVATSNEIREIVGWKPVDDPKADELRNSNMPQSELGAPPPGGASADQPTADAVQEN